MCKIGNSNCRWSGKIIVVDQALRDPVGFEDWTTGRTLERSEDFSEVMDGQEEGRVSATQILRLEQAATDPGVFGEQSDSIKFDSVRSLARQRLKESKSVLIFTDYRTIAENLREFLREEFGDTTAYVVGGVEGEEMNHEIDRFQTGQAKILIGTVGKIGTSLELTQADTVIFLNYPWKPSALDQAIDRAHRFDQVRNYLGRKLEIMFLEIEIPVSIDQLKAMVLERKRILAEMLINGNLTPQILDAFKDVDTAIVALIEEKTLGVSPAGMDEYEMTMMNQFRLKLGEVISATNAEKAQELWSEIADLYVKILEHKGSYFANMASLDYLSTDNNWNFRRTSAHPLAVLDIGSGPSVLERAYRTGQNKLNGRGFYLDITDLDFSERMLQLGLAREGKQILASFEQLSQIPDKSYEMVNISYALRYAAHPADAIRNMHRILKDEGLLVLILPNKNLLPDKFYQALEKIGFKPKVGLGAVLESKLEPEVYDAFAKEYGEEFAKDLARVVEGEFTYLIAGKSESMEEAKEVLDEDLRIERLVLAVDPGKVERFKNSAGRQSMLLVPEGIVGEIVYQSITGQDVRDTREMVRKTSNVRRVERLLVALARQIRIYEQTPDERKNQKKLKRTADEIGEQVEELQNLIDTAIKNIAEEAPDGLVRALEDFHDRPFIRGWLNRHNPQMIDKLIQSLQHANNNDIASSSLRDTSTFAEYGGINLNPSQLQLETQGPGIELNNVPMDYDFLEIYPINGFSPILIETFPFTNLPLFLGKSEKDMHLSSKN